MVIISEKDFLPVPPPPPYRPRGERDGHGNVQTPQSNGPWRTISALPSHILLHIVCETFPGVWETDRDKRTLRVLYWIATNLRAVCRGLYLASMHILRSTYLPEYSRLIKQPYSSDPFPHSSSPSSHPTRIEILSQQRETKVLDLFLLLTIRNAVMADDTSLHLSHDPDADADVDSSLRDLFAFMQPRSRLEDLVRSFGVSVGLVYTPSSSRASSSASSSLTSLPPYGRHPHALPFPALSISFSPRRVGLVLTGPRGKRTVISVPRERMEPLERSASRIIAQLQGWCDEQSNASGL